MHIKTVLLFAMLFATIALVFPIIIEEEPRDVSYGDRPSIGGNFSLVNHLGERVTSKNYEGQYLLVFFGFTHCPAVCPTGLLTMSQAMEYLGSSSKLVTPLFITVDPERDTPERLRDHLGNFNTSIIGLTGSKEEIEHIVSTYKVYSSKAKDDQSEQGYTMDHSAFIYLMDMKGLYLRHFRYDDKPTLIVDAINKVVG